MRADAAEKPRTHDDPEDPDRDDEAPELPPDEPSPAPIEEPPPQTGDKGPYVVLTGKWRVMR